MARRVRVTAQTTTAGAHVSDLTLVVIFVIGCVIAYVLSDRGKRYKVSDAETPGDTLLSQQLPNDRSLHTDLPPAGGPGVSASNQQAPLFAGTDDLDADIICTNYLNDDYEDSEFGDDLDPLPGDDGRSNSTRLGILKGGKQPRRSRPAGIRIKYPNDELAATAVRGYQVNDGPLRYWDLTSKLSGKKDQWKRGAGKRRHFKSSLPDFEAKLHAGGHTRAAVEMKAVEDCVMENWLRPVQSTHPPEVLERLRARASQDEWDLNGRWGKIPSVIVQLCRTLVKTQAIDISALVLAMAAEKNIAESPACPAFLIINEGFEGKEVERNDGSGELVKIAVPKNEYAAMEVLLGWFVLPYRGYLKNQWTDQSMRKPPQSRKKGEPHKGGEPSISQRTEAGLVLYPKIAKAVGEAGSEILLWLAWAGQRYLINRLFTPIGVDLFDGSARAAISPEKAGSYTTFKLDVTIFAPEAEDLATKQYWKNTQWLVRSKPGPAEKWDSWFLKDALNHCNLLGQQWIEKMFKVQDKQLDLAPDRIPLRRLFIRPGFAKHRIDQSRLNSTNAVPYNTFVDGRPTLLMQLRADKCDKWARNGELQLALADLRPSLIRFVNRRQNSWYTPPEGATNADSFHTIQVEMMLGLLIPALTMAQHVDLGPLGVISEKTEAARLTAHGRGKTHLDFGGLMPYIPRPSKHDQLKAEFWWPATMPRIGTFYLPYMRPSHPVQRRSVVRPKGDVSVQSDTVGWLLAEKGGIYTNLSDRSIAASVYKFNIVIVMLSLDDDIPKLHQDMDAGLVGLIRQCVSQGVSPADMRESVQIILEAFGQAIKLTSTSECQSTINMPALFSLGYTSDPRRKAASLMRMSGHEVL